MKATNDGSQNSPSLRFYMSDYALHYMPQFAGRSDEQILEAIKVAGCDGVQFANARPEQHKYARSLGLGITESVRINTSAEAEECAVKLADLGCECGTTHLGWGIESDDEAKRLIRSLLDACDKHNISIYPETHRSTLFQDIWRTVEFVKHFPDLCLNADYSHFYTGQEMVYGDINSKFNFLEPVFARARFMHGRIGDPGCMQVPVLSREDDRSFVKHFREMWTRTFRAFLHTAVPGDYFCFSSEVIHPAIFYGRTTMDERGEEVELSDRWQQSLLLQQIAQDCFDVAQSAKSNSLHTVPNA